MKHSHSERKIYAKDSRSCGGDCSWRRWASVQSVTVEFTIQGKVTSANEVKTPLTMMKGGKPITRMLKSKQARKDTERIKGLAFAAKIQQGWRVPEQATLVILAYNSGLDCGNVEKTIGDSIKGGLLIVDDRPKHLKSLFVEHQDRDHLGERYVVRVSAVHEGLPL